MSAILARLKRQAGIQWNFDNKAARLARSVTRLCGVCVNTLILNPEVWGPVNSPIHESCQPPPDKRVRGQWWTPRYQKHGSGRYFRFNRHHVTNPCLVRGLRLGQLKVAGSRPHTAQVGGLDLRVSHAHRISLCLPFLYSWASLGFIVCPIATAFLNRRCRRGRLGIVTRVRSPPPLSISLCCLLQIQYQHPSILSVRY